MTVRVSSSRIGTKLNQLLIFDGATFIGEYERAQDADINRKKKEVRNAGRLLLEVFRKHGPFVVRWNGKARTKSIRVGGVEVATIPRGDWELPSWL